MFNKEFKGFEASLVLLNESDMPPKFYMFDKFDVTVSPAQLGFAFAHNDCTHLATPHQQGEFTFGEYSLGLRTETPHIARVRELNGPAAYARTTNPAAKGCGEAWRHLPEMSTSSSWQLD